MTEFELNCLQELLNSLQRAEMAIIAFMGYNQGLNDGKRNSLQISENNQESELTDCNGSEIISIHFTKEELRKMPLQFRTEYRIDGSVVRCRKRPTGRNKFTYEMRYRRDGYNVTATAKNLDDCKAKFLVKLKEADKQIKNKGKKTLFSNFAIYYFEAFKKRKVSEQSYKADYSRLKTYLLPTFGNLDLCKITPGSCQGFLDNLVDKGKGKTAEECHSLLNQIFKGAIKHGYITQNPLDLVIKPKHEREHGQALTLEQEAEFLKLCKNHKFASVYITALYTGMRPNEYAHAEFNGDFVIAPNSKRKGGKLEYKKIPIHPMLARFVTSAFIEDFNLLKTTDLNTIRKNYSRNFSKITTKLYDLRTTFYTRCEMCGVAEPARNEFIGHSGGVLKDTYTDLPDSFLLKEGQKIRYNLDF